MDLINKEDWTDITGDQLLIVLNDLKLVREKLSTREWIQLPISYTAHDKGVIFELKIHKRKINESR